MNWALFGWSFSAFAHVAAQNEDGRRRHAPQRRELEAIEFEELIASCRRLASHRIGANVMVEVDRSDGGPALVANRGRIALTMFRNKIHDLKGR